MLPAQAYPRQGPDSRPADPGIFLHVAARKCRSSYGNARTALRPLAFSRSALGALLVVLLLGACDKTTLPPPPAEIVKDARPEHGAGDSLYDATIDSIARAAAAEETPADIQDSLGTQRFRINTTIGPIDGVLYGNEAPKTVGNFIDLARRRHFNRLPFHRVAPNFVIQTGNPNTRRRSNWRTYIDTAREISEERLLEWQNGGESSFGAPFEDEIDTNSVSVQRGYLRGTVAMANRGANSNGSQFFICLRDLPELPPHYTIFGHITKGMDLVDSIAASPIIPLRNEFDGWPVNPVEIRWVTMLP